MSVGIDLQSEKCGDGSLKSIRKRILYEGLKERYWKLKMVDISEGK